MELDYFRFYERTIKAIELMKLYNDAGWWEERKEQDIEEMLKREIVYHKEFPERRFLEKDNGEQEHTIYIFTSLRVNTGITNSF
ncbi:hypothetical protein [Peribacillus loiseleuriae]|uniref:Uncharacterized protein n=1 Tax=Peribacillus loiseleuriae TaxID=1679170 RepID=A0A0K9GTT9_9BACI|nr:hypothetical protein [Peribacillus loiseleuriae]KMY50075.1 hypothetical protein AC625_11635 [Peribacillus loiseleuriae]